MNSVSGTSREKDAHLGEVEEGRLTEQDVGQEHGAASQHFNLVFTVMMTPQELAKVPGEGRVGGAIITANVIAVKRQTVVFTTTKHLVFCLTHSPEEVFDLCKILFIINDN